MLLILHLIISSHLSSLRYHCIKAWGRVYFSNFFCLLLSHFLEGSTCFSSSVRLLSNQLRSCSNLLTSCVVVAWRLSAHLNNPVLRCSIDIRARGKKKNKQFQHIYPPHQPVLDALSRQLLLSVLHICSVPQASEDVQLFTVLHLIMSDPTCSQSVTSSFLQRTSALTVLHLDILWVSVKQLLSSVTVCGRQPPASNTDTVCQASLCFRLSVNIVL